MPTPTDDLTELPPGPWKFEPCDNDQDSGCIMDAEDHCVVSNGTATNERTDR